MSIFIFIVASNQAVAECYRWENQSGHRVVLNIQFIDSNYNPTGTIDNHPLDNGASYPYNDCNEFGLNTRAFVTVTRGIASWDTVNTVFGETPGGSFLIH